MPTTTLYEPDYEPDPYYQDVRDEAARLRYLAMKYGDDKPYIPA